MSIHLYTKIWANMRTCYCNGVTSDLTGPAAVARPSANVGPSVWPGARPWAGLGAGPETSAGPRAGLWAEPGTGAGTEPRAGAGRWPGLSRCNVSHVWRIKNVTSVISRALAQRRRPHLGPRLNGDGRISTQNKSAPAEHLDGGAQIALCYKAQLSKTTPRYRGS